MVMPEILQALRQDIDREIAHLDLIREAGRPQREEASQIAPRSRRVWRWNVEPGAESTFDALRTWLLAPYARSAPDPK